MFRPTWGLLLKQAFVARRDQVMIGAGLLVALGMVILCALVAEGWKQDRCIMALRTPGTHPAVIALMCRP